MSTTPDTGAPTSGRAEDQLVTNLSHWLTRQIGNDELLRKLQEIDTAELPSGGRSAIAELLVDLRAAAPGARAQLEVSVRETLETLVYGD